MHTLQLIHPELLRRTVQAGEAEPSLKKGVQKLFLSGKILFELRSRAMIALMVKAPSEADLVRLRHFLKRVETDAQRMPGEIDVARPEIAMLKGEIAYLESVGSKAFLLQIDIDYAAARCCEPSALIR